METINIRGCKIEDDNIEKTGNKFLKKLSNVNKQDINKTNNNGLSNYQYEYLNKSIYTLIELTLKKEIKWIYKDNIYYCNKYNIEIFSKNNCVSLKQDKKTVYWKHFDIDNYKNGTYEDVGLLTQLFKLVANGTLPLFNTVETFINTVYWNK